MAETATNDAATVAVPPRRYGPPATLTNQIVVMVDNEMADTIYAMASLAKIHIAEMGRRMWRATLHGTGETLLDLVETEAPDLTMDKVRAQVKIEAKRRHEREARKAHAEEERKARRAADPFTTRA